MVLKNRFQIFALLLGFLAASPFSAEAQSCFHHPEKYQSCLEDQETCAEFDLGYCESMGEKRAPEHCDVVFEAEESYAHRLDAVKNSLECFPMEALNEHPLYNPLSQHYSQAREDHLERLKDDENHYWVRTHITPLLKTYPELKCEIAFQMAVFGDIKGTQILKHKDCADDRRGLQSFGLAYSLDDRAIEFFENYFVESENKMRGVKTLVAHLKIFALGALRNIGNPEVILFLEAQLEREENDLVYNHIVDVIDYLKTFPREL